jgi:hypothetical protein
VSRTNICDSGGVTQTEVLVGTDTCETNTVNSPVTGNSDNTLKENVSGGKRKRHTFGGEGWGGGS